MSGVVEYVSQYTVSALPREHPEHYSWALTVEWRGKGWAVTRHSFVFCKTDARRKRPQGTYDRLPSGRSDAHLRTYRHSLEDALDIARKIAPKITINGWTVPEVLAKWEARQAREAAAS